MNMNYINILANLGCEPKACSGAATVSLALVDAFNHSVVAKLWTSAPGCHQETAIHPGRAEKNRFEKKSLKLAFHAP